MGDYPPQALLVGGSDEPPGHGRAGFGPACGLPVCLQSRALEILAEVFDGLAQALQHL